MICEIDGLVRRAVWGAGVAAVSGAVWGAVGGAGEIDGWVLAGMQGDGAGAFLQD